MCLGRGQNRWLGGLELGTRLAVGNKWLGLCMYLLGCHCWVGKGSADGLQEGSKQARMEWESGQLGKVR